MVSNEVHIMLQEHSILQSFDSHIFVVAQHRTVKT